MREQCQDDQSTRAGIVVMNDRLGRFADVRGPIRFLYRG